ncbi:MAG: hypothetical protein ACK4OP_16625 [Gemmobacter sp.]
MTPLILAAAIAISALAGALLQVELGVPLPLPLVGMVEAAAGFGAVVLAAVMFAIPIFRSGGLTAAPAAADLLRRRR